MGRCWCFSWRKGSRQGAGGLRGLKVDPTPGSGGRQAAQGCRAGQMHPNPPIHSTQESPVTRKERKRRSEQTAWGCLGVGFSRMGRESACWI